MSSIIGRIEESGKISISQSGYYSKDYVKNYENKHQLCYEVGSTLYYKDKRLFELTESFLRFKWVNTIITKLEEVKDVKDQPDNDIDEQIKQIRNTIKELLLQNIPYPERLKNYKRYLLNVGLYRVNNNIWWRKVKEIPFSNCLFISGISGIGKTRFLNYLEVNADCKTDYVCYLDLLKTDGVIDDYIIDRLIKEYFGNYYENAGFFIREYLNNSDQANVVFLVDNLDYAFQRGLQPGELKKLVDQYSLCDQIKWIFTINSGARYLVWSYESMEDLAKEYAFGLKDHNYSAYLKTFDYDMNKFSSEARVFESIIREKYSVQSLDEICLRKDNKFEYYLTPHVAEIMIGLGWSWEIIQKLTSLLYLRLCEEYLSSKISSFIEYKLNKDNLRALDWESTCKNLCIELGLYQLRAGKDIWHEEDCPVVRNNKAVQLESTGVITVVPEKDSVGRCFRQYIASDKIFWATLNSKILVNDNPSSVSWRDKVLKCIDDSEARYVHLSYYKELQKLYYLRILKDINLSSKELSELSSNRSIPQKYRLFFSSQVFRVVADTILYADERSQRYFLKSCMLFLKNRKDMEQKEAYMYLSLIFELFGAIKTTEKDFKDLVFCCKRHLLTVRPSNIITEFANLLIQKRRDISCYTLNYILCNIGNADAAAFEPLSEALCILYFVFFHDDYKALIHFLLNDSGLCVMKKKYRHLNKKKMQRDKEESEKIEKSTFSRQIFTHRNSYPYCLLESTISKICDYIVYDSGILDSHSLFWDNGWYEENYDDGKKLPFFIDLRRKSLNLSLTNMARTGNSTYTDDLRRTIMNLALSNEARTDNSSLRDDLRKTSLNLALTNKVRTRNRRQINELEILIETCLEHTGDSFAERAYREEALYLCRNSIYSDEKSPYAFTEKIYNYLIGFIDNPAMEYLMKQEDVQNYYARHNIFRLFNKQIISVALWNKKEVLRGCYVIDSEKASITVRTKENEIRIIVWDEIRYIHFKHR